MPQQLQQRRAADQPRADALVHTRVLPSSPDGFMAHTHAFEQRLQQKPPLRSKMEAEYERVALHALWRGVGHISGIDRNASAHTQSALQWDGLQRMSSADRAPGPDMRPAAPPQPRPVHPPAPALPNPLLSFPRAEQEARMAKRALATLLGISQQQPSWAQVQMQQQGDSRTAASGGSATSRPSSSAASAGAVCAASSVAHSRPHSAASPQPRAPYVAVRALRDADGLPQKIGSFPAPTPLDPNDPAYGNFRSDAWTSDQRFFHGSQRGADLAPSSGPSRDPAFDDPLFSSFSHDGLFQERRERTLLPPYRCKESVARPRADGSYAHDYNGGDASGPSQARLFMQRLVRNDSRPKAEMRFAGSAALPPAVEEARATASLHYVTVLESEERKRRRKEKADSAERAAERLARRREAAHYNRERVRAPVAGSQQGRRDERSLQQDGARPGSSGGWSAGDEQEATGSTGARSRSSSPAPHSPSRSASPSAFERMQQQQQQQQQQWLYQQRFQLQQQQQRPASAAAFQVRPAPPRHSSSVYAARISASQLQQQPIDTRTQQAFAALFA